jgi:antitoxin (DNA-binding transcriptional repressor) of toxin-antitoxin stability system
MQVISMHQAKSNLSSLIKRAASGETLLVGAYGRAEAMIAPISVPILTTKKIGILAGKLIVPDDFNAPLPEALLSAFEGN